MTNSITNIFCQRQILQKNATNIFIDYSMEIFITHCYKIETSSTRNNDNLIKRILKL